MERDEAGGGAMRVCLMIEGQEDVTWDDWVALAAACEEHGLEGLFRSDHYTSFGHEREWGALDAWATLAALGPLTERIRLGTMVSPVTFRHPSNLAKTVVTADHASGGRVELGLGAGWFEREHRSYGFPFPPTAERFSMLSEQVEMVHRLWDRGEEEVTFEGRHYRLEACRALPRPVQDPHPPLLLGGAAGPRAAALAARWADEYNVNFVTPEEAAAARERLDRACRRQGREPASLPLSLMTSTLVAAGEAGLRERARRLAARGGGDEESFLAARGPNVLTGTVEQVLERLAAYARAGVRRVLMQHLLHDDLETVALIGREIVPAAARL
jgi:F420-dependent oxidoreductase-like protein